VSIGKPDFPANWQKTPEFSLYFRVELAFNPPNLE